MWREVQNQAALEAETAALIERGFKKPNWQAAWAQGTKFIDRSPIHRFQGRYIEALEPDFEWHWLHNFREWLFRTFLSDVSCLHEFGAGSAHNLVAWREQFPGRQVVALDYAQSALKLAGKVGVPGHLFNLAEPIDFPLQQKGSGVLTFCALEQIESPRRFVDYLRYEKPKRVVHVEPIVEWYTNSSFDKLARDYHLKRGYMQGLPDYLPNVKYTRRMGFGSRFHEAYTVVIWEP